jgi:hypothetical protein
MNSPFAEGERDSSANQQPIEKMGASYKIKVAHPGPPSPDPLVETRLMPSVQGRNGSMEKVDPAITHTPLGALMPGPNSVPPPITVDPNYRHPIPGEARPFYAGVRDAHGDGSPVPLGS